MFDNSTIEDLSKSLVVFSENAVSTKVISNYPLFYIAINLAVIAVILKTM